MGYVLCNDDGGNNSDNDNGDDDASDGEQWQMEINGDESGGECAGYGNEDTINNVAERGLHSEPHHDTRFLSSTPAAPRALMWGWLPWL